MNLLAGLDEITRQNEPMSEHTWFRLGGAARYFVQPRDKSELVDIVRRCHENEVEMYVLGRGSNLLVADGGIDGVVVHISDKYFGKITIDGTKVRAGAGTSLNRLLQVCARKGLSGMECLAGIPGSVGGAVRINAGGRFGDIGNVAKAVQLLDSSGYSFRRAGDEIFFGYRMSNIMAKFILQAEFSLMEDDPDRIARLIKEVWMLKKGSQPVNSRNAGCIFKNPRALSAGALIDKAGLKGHSVGGATVSATHANFIVVKEGASSDDVLALIEVMRKAVKERFDMDLELELEVWQ